MVNPMIFYLYDKELCHMTAVESRLATGQTCLCHGTALHGICLMEFA